MELRGDHISSGPGYEVKITPSGLRHLDRLPSKVREAALATSFGSKAENSQRVGRPLMGELDGLQSARRGDYRIVCEILEDEKVVVIHRVQHRRYVYCRYVYRRIVDPDREAVLAGCLDQG